MQTFRFLSFVPLFPSVSIISYFCIIPQMIMLQWLSGRDFPECDWEGKGGRGTGQGGIPSCCSCAIGDLLNRFSLLLCRLYLHIKSSLFFQYFRLDIASVPCCDCRSKFQKSIICFFLFFFFENHWKKMPSTTIPTIVASQFTSRAPNWRPERSWWS